MEKSERIHQRVGLELGRGSNEMNRYTSQLPQDEGSRAVHTAVEGTLVDTEMRQFLVQAGIINHWEGSCLTPLQTIGDGNCLLHAVSLYMWGVQDKKLNLRRYLDRAMQDDRGALRKRWAHQRRAKDAAVPGVPIGGVNYRPGQWDGEWNTMVQMASAAPNESEPNLTRYMPLEEFHIFVLANRLRRPIVVFADTLVRDAEGNSWAPIPFGGIYLPLLHAPAECVRSPVLLAYNNQHFTPLLTTQTLPQNGVSPSAHQPPQTIPLMRQNGERLPVQYILPEEEGRDVLVEYLNIIPAEDSSNNTLLAALDIIPHPDHLNLFQDFVEREWQGTPQQRNASPDLSSFQKPVNVVRPLAKSERPIDKATRATESMPVPCTEDVDGPQASHSPLDESFLRMKLCQGEQTATVNPDQMGLALPDYAASVPQSPVQENIVDNIAILPNEGNFGRSQYTTAGYSGSSSIQPKTSAPPLPSQGNMANPLTADNFGRSQQHEASEEGQQFDGMTMQDIQSVSNGRNESSQNDGSVSTTSRPSYAAAVKSNPGPLSRPSIPKQKLFFTPTKKPTCKNPECKAPACPQNGGYCTKCHRKNSAEKRRERRESLSSLPSNVSRADTPVNIGRVVNRKNKKKGAQPKPNRPQTTPTHFSSLEQQKSGLGRQLARGMSTSTGRHSDRNTQRSVTQAPYQSDSPETPPSKLVGASSSAIQSTPEEPARLIETNTSNMSSQVQVPDSVQDSDPNGTCKTPGCTQLGQPNADGLCINCWSRKQDAATAKVMQQRQAASGDDQDSCHVSNNISKQPEKKPASAAKRDDQDSCHVSNNISKQPEKKPASAAKRDGEKRNGESPPQKCKAPRCKGVVDERINEALCRSCVSRLDEKNRSSIPTTNGDDSNTPSPFMGTSSLGQPAEQSKDRFYTEQPDVRRCFYKGCKKNATRGNGYYCSVHAPSGTPHDQQGQQQFGPQSSMNTSQQFTSSSQLPSSLSLTGSLTVNGDVKELHMHEHHHHHHHHHHPPPDGSQANGTGDFDRQSQAQFFTAKEEQYSQQSHLRARGSHSTPRPTSAAARGSQ